MGDRVHLADQSPPPVPSLSQPVGSLKLWLQHSTARCLPGIGDASDATALPCPKIAPWSPHWLAMATSPEQPGSHTLRQGIPAGLPSLAQSALREQVPSSPWDTGREHLTWDSASLAEPLLCEALCQRGWATQARKALTRGAGHMLSCVLV